MKQKRNFIRFDAEKNTVGLLSFNDSIKSFNPKYIGLVFNEAYKGCGMIMLYSDEIKKNMNCIVQCGNLNPVEGRVAWVCRLDSNTLKVGIEYLI